MTNQIEGGERELEVDPHPLTPAEQRIAALIETWQQDVRNTLAQERAYQRSKFRRWGGLILVGFIILGSLIGVERENSINNCNAINQQIQSVEGFGSLLFSDFEAYVISHESGSQAQQTVVALRRLQMRVAHDYEKRNPIHSCTFFDS